MCRIAEITAFVLATLILATSVVALNRYKIELNKDDFSFGSLDGYTRIEGSRAFATEAIGYPELPLMGFKYYLPADIRVTGIRIIKAEKERIPGNFVIYPAQKPILNPDEASVFIPPDNDAYASMSPYPGKAARFAYAGFMRGHQLADIAVYPFEYIPAKKELYFYNNIEFEFVTDGYNPDPPIMMSDASTIEEIKRIVRNPNAMADLVSPTAAKIRPPNPDTITLTIITDPAFVPAFNAYALYKRALGLNAEVVTTSYIYGNYSGLTNAEKIRNFIKDKYFTGRAARWVLLGGDVNVIPAAYLQAYHANTLSDFYYACLDGTWDSDGDGLLGETTLYGDTVDLYPEVAIGRLPCRTLEEAYTVIGKIKRYQMGSHLYHGYERKALLISTSIMTGGDGARFADELEAIIPSSFFITQFHNDSLLPIMEALNGGQGLIVFYGHSGGEGNGILIRNVLGWQSGRQWLYSSYFDTMNTNGQFSIFLNSTCYSTYLENASNISRSFMLNPNGGGVAYLGPTTGEVASELRPFHKELFSGIYDSRGGLQLGEALNNAKELLIPPDPERESFQRMALYSYMLLGDPQLEVWTEMPKTIEIYPSSQRFIPDEATDVKLTIWGDNSRESGIRVAFTYNGDLIDYSYTDADGIVDFGDYTFNTAGYAVFIASKAGHYVAEDTVPVLAYSSGCRGDINLNAAAYEAGDALVFTNYFLKGDSAFTIDRDAQKAATDINHDHVILTMEDYVFLLRIYCGDAQPLAKPIPEMTAKFYFDGTSVHVKTPSDIGAALFIFEGEVEPTAGLAAEGMEIQHAHRDGTTYVLAYSMEKGRAIKSGEALKISGQGKLVSVEAATYDGAKLLIDQDFQLPKEYYLSQNYPNPFNPTTSIDLALPVASEWTITIYNISGQMVANFPGYDEAGITTISWDASDQASGVYLYKATAGDFQATKKMVVLK